MSDDPLRPLADEADLDAACAAPVAVLLKHSPWCGTSLLAMRRVRAFAERHPDIPVYVLDVVGQRPLSQGITHRVGVPHESPQAIVLRAGDVAWHASHGEVTVDALEREAAARPAG